MSADCIGGKMLVALADPGQTRLACPECGAHGLQRASVVNGHGVVPHHKFVPHRSAGIVAVQPPKCDLTPSEVALAKILAAWEGWETIPSGASADVAAVLVSLTISLVRNGFVASGALTDKGRALLARARKAGVL